MPTINAAVPTSRALSRTTRARAQARIADCITQAVVLSILLLASSSSLIAASRTYFSETFTENASNWNPAAGSWAMEGGRYSNCIGACNQPPLFVSRAWTAVATNADSYTIDADLFMITARECKIIFTGANNNEDYRVDIDRAANLLRLHAPANSQTTTWSPSTSPAHSNISSGSRYHLRIEVKRTSVIVYYQKNSEPEHGIGISTYIYPDGKIGLGSYDGDCDFDNISITGEEGVGNGSSLLIPIFGYERTEGCDEGPYNSFKPGESLREDRCDRPLFSPWDRDKQAWWNVMVEEMDYSNIRIVAAHNRGCSTSVLTEEHGSGDMCPNQLRKLVTAIQSRRSSLKVAMFDDSPTLGAEFDWGQTTHWETYLWDRRWRLFFRAIPAEIIATERLETYGRPLIFIWHPGGYNHQGNLSRALDWLRMQIQNEFKLANPFIMVLDSFYRADSTLEGHVDGVYSWFDPSSGQATLSPPNFPGPRGATVVPGFRHPSNAPGCGGSCSELPRFHGHQLIAALEGQKNTELVLLEGWTNIIESAGYYRSLEGNDLRQCTHSIEQNQVDFPSQTLNIVRRYSSPNATSITLEAENADGYQDSSPGNVGGAYRLTDPSGSGSSCVYNDLDVYQTGDRFFVGSVDPGIEWIEFRDIFLIKGRWEVIAHYSTPGHHAVICATLNASSRICSNLPRSGSWTSFQEKSLGTFNLGRGLHRFRIDFVQDLLNLDKIEIKRVG